MAGGQTIAKRSALVKLGGIPYFWSVLTGGAVTVQITKVHNGGTKQVDIITSRPEVGNVIMSMPYNPHAHQALERQLLAGPGSMTGMSVSLQDLDANDTAVGKPRTYTGCVLMRCTPRDYDASSNAEARLEIEVAVGNVTR